MMDLSFTGLTKGNDHNIVRRLVAAQNSRPPVGMLGMGKSVFLEHLLYSESFCLHFDLETMEP